MGEKNVKMKWVALLALIMLLLLGVEGAYAEETAEATIDLVFDGKTYTDTVQVEWTVKYPVPEGGVKWDGSDEFLYMSDFTQDDLVDCPSSELYAKKYVKNQIAFMGIEGKNFFQIEQIAAKHGARIIGYLAPTEDYVIEFVENKSYDELIEIANKLKEEDVLLGDTVGLHYAYESIANLYPSDPWGGVAWNEKEPEGNNWAVEAIHAPSAWDYIDFMSEINVGIIDSTFLEEHPDLHFAVAYDRVNLSNAEKYKYIIYLIDTLKAGLLHGTHVAGTFSAIHNDIGISGVFPKGRLVGIGTQYQNISDDAIDNIEDLVRSFNTNTSMPLEKFYFLIMRRENVKIINYSMGQKWTPEEITQLKDEKINAASVPGWTRFFSVDQGMSTFFNRLAKLGYDYVFVNSAGNDAMNCAMNGWPMWVDSPSFQKRLIVVGSHQKSPIYDDYRFTFSLAYNYGERIDVVAPGEGIYSTYYGPINNSYSYWKMSGTSMAAPHVSGVAAMLASINPDLSGIEIKKIISSKGEEISDGHGNMIHRLDAYACVKEAFERATGNGTLYVTVTNKETGNFVSDVHVSIKPLEICQEIETISADTGLVYPYPKTLKLGQYEVTVSKDGYQSYTEKITVTRDSEININATLKPIDAPEVTKGKLNGMVTFNAQGVNGIKVNVLKGTTPVITLITANGYFDVDLEPGTYTLSIDADGYVPTSRNITVFTGKTTTENIELNDSMYAVATQTMNASIQYDVKLFNAHDSITQLDMKVTLRNGTVLMDTANGIRSGVTMQADGFTFQIDDELAQGAQLEVTATDGQRRTYSGAIVLSSGLWSGAKKLPDSCSNGGYWDANGFYHESDY